MTPGERKALLAFGAITLVVILAACVFAAVSLSRRLTPAGLAVAGAGAIAESVQAGRENVKAATEFQDTAAAHQAAAQAHSRRADAAEKALAQVLEAAKTQAAALEDRDAAIAQDKPVAAQALVEHLAHPDNLAKCQSTVESQQALIVDLDGWKSDALELAESRDLTIKNYGLQVSSLKAEVREQEEIARPRTGWRARSSDADCATARWSRSATGARFAGSIPRPPWSDTD